MPAKSSFLRPCTQISPQSCGMKFCPVLLSWPFVCSFLALQLLTSTSSQTVERWAICIITDFDSCVALRSSRDAYMRQCFTRFTILFQTDCWMMFLTVIVYVIYEHCICYPPPIFLIGKEDCEGSLSLVFDGARQESVWERCILPSQGSNISHYWKYCH